MWALAGMAGRRGVTKFKKILLRKELQARGLAVYMGSGMGGGVEVGGGGELYRKLHPPPPPKETTTACNNKIQLHGNNLIEEEMGVIKET